MRLMRRSNEPEASATGHTDPSLTLPARQRTLLKCAAEYADHPLHSLQAERSRQSRSLDYLMHLPLLAAAAAREAAVRTPTAILLTCLIACTGYAQAPLGSPAPVATFGVPQT